MARTSNSVRVVALCVIVAAGISFSGALSAQEAHDVTMGDIVAKWRQRQRLVRTARFDIEWKKSTPASAQVGTEGRGPLNIVYSDSKENSATDTEANIAETHTRTTTIILSESSMRHEWQGRTWQGNRIKMYLMRKAASSVKLPILS
jgi:hypothetical protein